MMTKCSFFYLLYTVSKFDFYDFFKTFMLLFSKDTFNWSNVTVKTFIMFQKYVLFF